MPSTAVPRQPSRCGLFTNSARYRRRADRSAAVRGCRRACSRPHPRGRIPSSRTPSSSRSTAVIQPPSRAVRAQPVGLDRQLDRHERAVLPVHPGVVAGLGELEHRVVGGELVAGLASAARSRRRSRATSAGLPSHQVATSSGRVRATREPDMYDPAASDSPSGPPSSPISASASASTCGRPMTRAIAASWCRGGRGTGRAPRSQTSSARRSQALEVGVVLDGQRPRRVAEQQRVGRVASRSPRCRRAGGRRRSVACGTSLAHRVRAPAP